MILGFTPNPDTLSAAHRAVFRVGILGIWDLPLLSLPTLQSVFWGGCLGMDTDYDVLRCLVNENDVLPD